MDKVAVSRDSVLITKHGKPVAKWVPVTPQEQTLFGLHAGLGSEAADFDLTETVDVVWAANEGKVL